MGPSVHHRHPGAHGIRQNNQFEYEGLAGTLLDLWVEDLHGAQHVFGLWQADQLTGRGQVDRCILSLGPGFNLERIRAEVGPLPARNWLCRESYVRPAQHVWPWPPLGRREPDRTV